MIVCCVCCPHGLLLPYGAYAACMLLLSTVIWKPSKSGVALAPASNPAYGHILNIALTSQTQLILRWFNTRTGVITRTHIMLLVIMMLMHHWCLTCSAHDHLVTVSASVQSLL